MLDTFLKHPRENNLTYFQHLIRAWSLGYQLAKGSVALFIHGLVPDWFQKTGSEVVQRAHDRLSEKK
jgi:hypothetical protein